MSDLQSALEHARPAIEMALAAAQAELTSLRSREAELLQLIQRADAALGNAVRSPGPLGEGRVTLHQALARILREGDNAWMSVQELTQAVNARGLYRKRDGSPVEVNQVHARTNNYRAIFEKDGGRIRLREESYVLSTLPDAIVLFRDDDTGFFDWLDKHPAGFFLNSERSPTSKYLVLHRPGCSHFKGDRAHLNWTKDYVKLVAEDRSELEGWATDTFGEDQELTLCSSCFGQ
jgi:hypothetical protein